MSNVRLRLKRAIFGNRMNQIKSIKNIAATALLFIFSLGLYTQLYRKGYLPPLSYFVDLFQSDNSEQKISLPLPTERKLLNYDRSIAEIISNQNIDRSQTSIAIEKSKYRLTLYYQEKAIKSYPVVFGKNPVGDKFKEGDYKTPEGIFKIRDLYPHRSWSKFIWLDYPNSNSWKKHLKAKQKGKIDSSASIGGEIGIHGVPEGSDYLIVNRKNWTWGCIALKNKDVDEIYNVVRVGTTIEIIP